MHFIRQITQDPNDVRSRIWLVYKCACCGEEKWYKGKFGPNATPLKECPKCKVTDDTSNFEYLIKQKQSLEQQAQAIQVQLQTVNLKLASLQEQQEASASPRLESFLALKDDGGDEDTTNG